MMDDGDFIESLGLPFLAHRLRRASELLLEGTAAYLRDQQIAAPPRSVSTLLLLKRDGPLGITQIANRLRLTHPLIIKLVARLEEVGYVSQQISPEDRRRRVISLTEAGAEQTRRIEAGVEDIERSFRELLDEIGIDLFEGVQRLEAATRDRTMEQRLAKEAAPSS